ncbi:hypothetical protein [Candidatus Uabimicrobium amorphum]|uniref:Uncharacterized protein n=1 Tax=Uabimicrobium amorphum TaxID=2596890 RepID=A0A5S9IH43_UABAM|nr:hypothetical protein [Candidatus Uabimicrobium amorphum]BBM81673.1 hypothetical protein UABAM_00012 [Candidatus Uabimicrobium amorphum]
MIEVIAYYLSTIINAQNVYALESSQIVESGPQNNFAQRVFLRYVVAITKLGKCLIHNINFELDV